QNQDGSGWGVYAQRYAALGTPLGGEFRVNTTTTGDQQDATIAMNATGQFVIAWDSDGQDGSGLGVYAQVFAAGGIPVGGEFQVNTTMAGDQALPSAGMDDYGFLLFSFSSQGADGDGWGVFGQYANSAGSLQGQEFQINTTTF